MEEWEPAGPGEPPEGAIGLLCSWGPCSFLFPDHFQGFFFADRVSHSPDWPLTGFVAKDDFDLLTILYLSPECYGYRHVPPHPVYRVGDTTQGRMHDRQALHQLNHTSSPSNDCFNAIQSTEGGLLEMKKLGVFKKSGSTRHGGVHL